MTKEIK